MKRTPLQKKKPEALPQEGGTLSGMSGAGVAPAGKHAPKQPYVAPSFTTTDVDIEPFCVVTSARITPSTLLIEEEEDGGNINNMEINWM
ncbi:MAG: hypothetical protein LBS46_07505 [Dysgonamonadaceae bacterium]|jgi:hypothetical protein|nr:hypothetical protein [Dysgonamonadaceae bacterium]